MKIVIQGKTPQVNNLYFTTKFGRRVMNKDARQLKEQITEETMKQATEQNYNQPDWIDRLLKVKVVVYENWFTKKHTIWKKDIANREKFLIDAIMDGLRIDDSQIWEHRLVKATEDDPEKFHAEVTLDFHIPEVDNATS